MIITVTLNPALDRTLTIPRFSTGTVNRAHESRLDPGGKGVNVCKVLKTLGEDPLATGFLGGSAGRAIADALDSLGIQHDFVAVTGETRTNLKIYDPELLTYTDINDLGDPVSEESVRALEEKLLLLAKPGDTVLFAGSAPRGIAPELPAAWARKLSARGVKVAADQDGAQLLAMIPAKPFLIKPNEHELKEMLNLPNVKEETLCRAARELVRGGIAHVVVSLGEKGALFADAEGVLFAQGPKVDAVSTVGAGDSLTAALLFSAERELEREDAARLAIATAAAKVTCPGSSPPSMALVQHYFNQVTISTISFASSPN